MGYLAPNAVIVGDPVKKDDYQKVADNTVDHQTRVLALETGSAIIEFFDFDIHNLSQYVNSASTLEQLASKQAKQALTLTGSIVTDLVGATSGVMEIDILTATSVGGAYTTVFSTKPSFTANGSAQESSNAVFSVTSIAAGDWIRLDVTSVSLGARTINVALTAVPA